NAIFNVDKLAWFNLQYIQRMPDDALIAHLRPEFEKAGLWHDSFNGDRRPWFSALLAQLPPPSQTLLDFAPQARPFIVDRVEFDPAAIEKFLKDEGARRNLATLADRLEALPEFNHENVEQAVRQLASELQVKPGALMGAARVALT